MCSFRTVLLLIRIFLEYCQCVNDIPSISTDMLTRLADLLKVRDSTALKSHDPTLVQPLVVSKQEKTLLPRDNLITTLKCLHLTQPRHAGMLAWWCLLNFLGLSSCSTSTLGAASWFWEPELCRSSASRPSPPKTSVYNTCYTHCLQVDLFFQYVKQLLMVENADFYC